MPSPLPPGHAHYQYWIENVEPYMFGPSIAPYPAHPDSNHPDSNHPDSNRRDAVDRLFRIVVSVYDGTIERYLFALLTSIRNQTYAHWELVIADATGEPEKQQMVARHVASDPRIRRIPVDGNLGISGNTNRALDAINDASDDGAVHVFVVFADHDDTLSPHALNELALAIRSQPEAVLVYSDEDKLSDDGDRRLTPHFKADWSPDLLHNVNYITHLTAIRADVLAEVGLLRSECDGAQDFDLLLRVVAHLGAPAPGDPRIVHVPKVLYHWRLAETSTAANFAVKSEALDAGVLALNDHFRSTAQNATVEAIADRPGFYRVRHRAPVDQRVVLVLLGIRDVSAARARLDRVLRRTDPGRLSRIITDADLGPVALPVEQIASTGDLIDIGERKSLAANETAVMTLCGNATPTGSDWCEDLLGALMQDHVFAVAPRVLSPGRQIVDAGLVMMDGELVPLVLGTKSHDSVFGSFEWVRNVDALSGRAFVCRTADWAAMLRAQHAPTLRTPVTPRTICDLSAAQGRVNLVWSHTTFTITGSSDPETQFGNPQFERVGGTIIPTRGFDPSFAHQSAVHHGGSVW